MEWVFFSQMAPHTQAEVLSSHWDRPYSREVAVFPAVCFYFNLHFSAQRVSIQYCLILFQNNLHVIKF